MKCTGSFKLFGKKFSKDLKNQSEVAVWIIVLILIIVFMAALGFFLIAGAWYILNMIFGWGLWSWQSSFGIWLICVILKFFFGGNAHD